MKWRRNINTYRWDDIYYIKTIHIVEMRLNERVAIISALATPSYNIC